MLGRNVNKKKVLETRLTTAAETVQLQIEEIGEQMDAMKAQVARSRSKWKKRFHRAFRRVRSKGGFLGRGPVVLDSLDDHEGDQGL
jgi:hypothetical protein